MPDFAQRVKVVAGEDDGLSVTRFKGDGSTKNGVIKATPGTLKGISCGNHNAAQCYLRLYNQTTAPSTSATPVAEYEIPGSTAGAGREVQLPAEGIAFSTGIAYRIVTGNGFITRSAGELAAWENLFNASGSVNPSLANVRQAFSDIFSGAGNAASNRTHLLAVARRKATRAEKLLGSGSGSTGSPATMGFEGTVAFADVDAALNLP